MQRFKSLKKTVKYTIFTETYKIFQSGPALKRTNSGEGNTPSLSRTHSHDSHKVSANKNCEITLSLI